MNEMVERVARAIHDHERKIQLLFPSLVQHPYPAWEDTPDAARETWRAKARDAIAAMSEPTEAMINVGREVSAVARTEEAFIGYFGAQECWKTMIDEALTDKRA